MKAVVMAGGFGTRIQPLSSSVPKPMIPVLNKPMMEYIILSLKDAGIRDIAILLYFKPEVIKDYFGDGKAFGVNIEYFTPDDDYGTAGAVKKAEKFLDEKFIVVSGDLITDFNIPEIIGYHNAKQSKATITLTSVADPLQFGVVITDVDGKIVRFLEKPGWGEVFSDTINTGIYVFEPEVLSYIPENKNFDFSKDLFPSIMARGIDIFGYNAKGYWRDVGNPDSYRTSLQEITAGQVKLPIEQKRRDYPEGILYHGYNVEIDDTAVITGSVLVGDNCKIGANVTLSDISAGDNCVISANSVITKSILWNKVTVGSDCNINNAVFCDNVVVGEHVKCENGAIIAEGTTIGNNVIIEKDIMAWPDKTIEDGSIVSSNLIWGDKWKNAIFEGGMVSARTNVELSADMAAKLGAAYGSMLPQGSKILTSRDYHKASRMIKRAFLGGLLSTGVNAVDLQREAIPVARYKLTTFGEVGAVHFRQSAKDATHTEILIYDENGDNINSTVEKNLDRLFFRENFRRVAYNEVGDIFEKKVRSYYTENFIKELDVTAIQSKNSTIVVDVHNGVTDSILPDLYNKVGVEAVILNANNDEAKLSRSNIQIEQTFKNLSGIVTALSADAGYVIYPSGEKLAVVCDKGELLRGDKLLLAIILLIDKTVKKPVKIYLPAYTPTAVDSMLKNVEIVRGKVTGIKSQFLQDYFFMGDMEGRFKFTNHMAATDAMFASMKIHEMTCAANVKLSDVIKELPKYKYKHTVINCPVEVKGYLMRKMSEEARERDASFLDGIKLMYKDGWVHMIPDQYSPDVHLYVEGATESVANSIHKEYVKKINEWISEEK